MDARILRASERKTRYGPDTGYGYVAWRYVSATHGTTHEATLGLGLGRDGRGGPEGVGAAEHGARRALGPGCVREELGAWPLDSRVCAYGMRTRCQWLTAVSEF